MEKSTESSRIVIIDALRGFALVGVVLVHMTEQYIAGPLPDEFMQGATIPDYIVMGIVQFFFFGKFFAIFSFLFGLSFFIQMDSAAQRGEDFSGRFLWRAILLFIIGYLHQLFYRGDILTIYALLTPFLIPFHKVSNKWILAAAVLFFLSVPRFIAFTIVGNGNLFGLESINTSGAEALYIETLRYGSLTEVFAQNAIYGMKVKMNFQLLSFGRLYYTFGYFLLGLLIGKIGVFKKLEVYRKRIRKTLLYAVSGYIVSFILLAVTFSTAPQPIDFSKWQHVAGLNFIDWTNLALAIIITCGFILLYDKKRWNKRLAVFAPYGRMALTNYFVQSLIGTFILFGWGLGQMGQIQVSILFLIGIGIIVLQTWFSKYWLKHFKFGPLEWLWRSATYFKWQPFKKK